MEEQARESRIIETVVKNSKKLGYNYEMLSTKDKEYLKKVEKAITNIFELETKAKEMLSRNVVSVKGVSKKANIARQTLYNNPILKEYIDYRSQSFVRIDASKIDSKKDEEISRLKEEVTALHKRDVEFEEAKREIKELRKKLREKDERISMLRKSKFHTIH